MANMNEMQRFLVTDHIARLEDDATVLRAGRARRSSGAAGLAAGARGRLGLLLVAFGVAVAGPSRTLVGAPSAAHPVPANASSTASDARNSPCPDDATPLPRAA